MLVQDYLNYMTIYAESVEKIAKKYLKRGLKVFDCGCGNGLHSMILKKYASGVIAGDLENRTRPEYPLNFRKISVNSYGIKNEFDAVFSFDVIEHVEEDLKFIKELARITKPGGRIIIGTPNRRRLSNTIKAIFGQRVVYPYKLGYDYESGGDIIHLREYTMDELTGLAKRSGNLKVLEKKPVFLGIYTSFGSVGIKKPGMKLLEKYCNHLFIVLEKSL